MAKRGAGRGAIVVAGLLGGGSVAPAAAQVLNERAQQQIQAIFAEKTSRTPAQKKIATSLLYAHRESLGRAMVQGLGPLRRVANRAGLERDGLVVVDIRADVTDGLLRSIAGLGGHVASAYPAFGAVRARVPIQQVEAIAELPEVRHVGPRQGFLTNPVVISEGDVAHAVAPTRTTLGKDGTGVKVGVLSDGVDSLADRQAAGELPPTCPQTGACVQVLSGQAGSGDEGTAMLELVHDLAPGAKLYFATAVDGDASFAANILALRDTHGCDIIVDDVTYFDEGAFQDGVIARAVNTVTSNGALFFSSAGNSGRYDAGTSGTWEGDFLSSGTTISFFDGTAWQDLPVHSWNGATGGSATNANALTGDAPYAISLKWSDPLGAAVTDYDLFLFDSTLSTVYDFSIEDQTVGGQDPFEIMGGGYAGEKIVVVRWSGATKALRLDTNRGELAHATDGATVGHNGADSSITVAAADVATASGAFTGGAANPVTDYSSDGPRRMFYHPNGTAITTGKVTFASGGGREVQKPDITAADCVVTAFPSGSLFNPFCGTSAAAPHAAAVAAVLKSSAGNPSNSQVLAAMLGTALDVTPDVGRDRNSGVGIVMADRAADAFAPPAPGNFYTLSPCRVFDTRVVGVETTGAPLACGTTYDFTMVGGTCSVPTGAKAISINAVVAAPTAFGGLLLFASDTPVPTTPTLSFIKGLTVGNNAVASLGASGKMSVRCSGMGTTHVIVDVNGYFLE